MDGAHGQQLPHTDDCHGDDGYSRFDCNIGSPFFEGTETLRRAPSLREEEYGNAALRDDARPLRHALQRSARVGAIDRHMAGALEVPAQEWNRKEALLGEEPELMWQAGQNRGNVHVAGVVRHEY